MQPHVKIIKLYLLKTRKEQLVFIKKHKTDKLFVDLLVIATSPDYKFPTLNLPITTRPTITAPTKDTMGKFKTLIYIGDTKSDFYDRAILFLSGVDIPTTAAYSIILNRALLVSYADIDAVIKLKSRINRNEFIVSYGYLEYPFLLTTRHKNIQLLNAYYDNGAVLVTSLDGIRITVTDLVYVALLQLLLPTEWVVGYMYDDNFIIVDAYPADAKLFSERLTSINRRKIVKNLQNINVTPFVEIKDTDDIKKHLQYNDKQILIRKDIPPLFGKQNAHIVDLDYLKIKEK